MALPKWMNQVGKERVSTDAVLMGIAEITDQEAREAAADYLRQARQLVHSQPKAMQPLGVTRFGPPRMIVKDVARSAKWYSRMLGMEVQSATPAEGTPAYVSMAAADPDASGALISALIIDDGSNPHSGKKPSRKVIEARILRAKVGVRCHFQTNRVEELFNSVKRKRAKIVKPIDEDRYGRREFTIQDPDGYLIAVGQES